MKRPVISKELVDFRWPNGLRLLTSAEGAIAPHTVAMRTGGWCGTLCVIAESGLYTSWTLAKSKKSITFECHKEEIIISSPMHGLNWQIPEYFESDHYSDHKYRIRMSRILGSIDKFYWMFNDPLAKKRDEYATSVTIPLLNIAPTCPPIGGWCMMETSSYHNVQEMVDPIRKSISSTGLKRAARLMAGLRISHPELAVLIDKMLDANKQYMLAADQMTAKMIEVFNKTPDPSEAK